MGKAKKESLTRVKEIIPKDLKTSIVDCSIHGEQKVYKLGTSNRLPECPECVQKRIEEEEVSQYSSNSESRLQGLLEGSGVGKRHLNATLDNYIAENEGQKEAVAQCRWLLKHFDYSTGLIFIGDKGTGKNHLAIGTIREVIKSGKRARLTVFLDFMREVKGGYTTKESETEIIKRFVAPDLLVIDEVGRQFQSDTEYIILHDLIDKRYLAMKPTILISNMDMKELQEVVGKAAIDRFTEGANGKKTVNFDWESYRRKKEYDKELS